MKSSIKSNYDPKIHVELAVFVGIENLLQYPYTLFERCVKYNRFNAIKELVLLGLTKEMLAPCSLKNVRIFIACTKLCNIKKNGKASVEDVVSLFRPIDIINSFDEFYSNLEFNKKLYQLLKNGANYPYVLQNIVLLEDIKKLADSLKPLCQLDETEYVNLRYTEKQIKTYHAASALMLLKERPVVFLPTANVNLGQSNWKKVSKAPASWVRQ